MLTEKETREVVISYRVTANEGPHWIIRFVARGRVQFKAKKFTLAKIADVIHNWVHNGVSIADEPGAPTPVDSETAPVVAKAEEGGDGTDEA